MTAPVYDEVGSRTRQAWLRTGLGVGAVALLVLRSLLLAQAPAWLTIASLVPAVAFLAVAVRRSIDLTHAESPPARAGAVAIVAVSLLCLALAGVVAVFAVG